MAVVLFAVALAGCASEREEAPLLVPGLAQALPDLSAVRIEQAGQTFDFRRAGDQWWSDAADWRVDRRWLQPLLLNLAQARCDEARTADPARFARIGVEGPMPSPTADPAGAGGPTQRDSTAFARPTGRITLSLAGAAVAVVVGHPHPRSGTYVRVEGAPHSCLTHVDLRLPAQGADWLDPNLWPAELPAPESVTVEDRGAAPLVLRRSGTRYLPEGISVAVTPMPDAFVAALLGLRHVERRAAAPVDGTGPDGMGEADRVLRFEAVPGEPIVVALRREGERLWAQVEAPSGQGQGFAGREFLLPPDVASPLQVSREALGGASSAAP